MIFSQCAKRIFKTCNTYLVRRTDLFSLRLSNKKNDNSQHNKSRPLWLNQNYTHFLSDWQKIYFLVVHENLNSIPIHLNSIENCCIKPFKNNTLEEVARRLRWLEHSPETSRPRLQPRPGRAQEPVNELVNKRDDKLVFRSLSLPSPLPLSKTNELKNKKKWVF